MRKIEVVYCEKCGNPVPDDSLFCPSCGAPVAQGSRVNYGASAVSDLRLANWFERFVAWIIDVLVINVFLAILSAIIYFNPFVLSNSNWLPFWGWIPFVSFGGTSVASFLYWTLIESANNGRSIGKTAMRLRVVQTNGRPARIDQIAISSIGKSFLLIIDFIIGLILYPRKHQRVFNHISQTIVIHEQN
ncbi:MAG: RDD family protein [Candidatus Bathyarchaeota archaeon]|nr:RDD family protein [Candidatus Bathyarchaeota archaeon]